MPVGIGEGGPAGFAVRAEAELLPPGGRRAGVLGHEYRAQLIGLTASQYTGWLEVDDSGERTVYAPHTYSGFKAPRNKRLLLIANGLLAKRGLREARRSGRIERLRSGSGASPSTGPSSN